jgi:hypothetical protein
VLPVHALLAAVGERSNASAFEFFELLLPPTTHAFAP